MRLSRVYVDSDVRAGSGLLLEGSAVNHVSRVLRLRVGESLSVFNGRGGEFDAIIEEIHRDRIRVGVRRHRNIERESPCRISLVQGISRGERMDWVVQKATELGVAAIAPVFTERSVVHLDDKQAARKVQHWRAIVIGACEQSGRNTVPAVAPPTDLYELLQQHTASPGIRLLLSPEAERSLDDIQAEPGCEVAVLIGPEGGLSDLEREAATNVGFQPVRLGPRVLRTETAAVSALTLLQQKFGDL